MNRITVLLLIYILSTQVEATTWAEKEVEDPISGSQCTVSTPASSGSYVYQWPSKYDGVYWPFTEFSWVWFCPASGYASLGNDFENLTDSEIVAIREFLSKNYGGTEAENKFENIIWLMETSYSLRNKDTTFWSFFNRVKVLLFESHAESLRFETIDLLLEEIQNLEPGTDLVQRLFVLGDYYRRLGDYELAEETFKKAEAVEWVDEEGRLQKEHPYFQELIDERRELFP